MYAGGGTATLEPPPDETESVHPQELATDGTMVQDALIPRWLPLLLLLLLLLAVLLVILWFLLVKPQINAAAQNEVKKQLAAAGITPGQKPSTATTAPPAAPKSASTPTTAVPTPTTVPTTNFNNSLTANGNGTTTYTVPTGKTLNITDLLVQNTAGDTGTVSLDRGSTTLLAWSMANFRDLDYHWITPINFTGGQQVNLVVSGCTDVCKPGIYFAGSLG